MNKNLFEKRWFTSELNNQTFQKIVQQLTVYGYSEAAVKLAIECDKLYLVDQSLIDRNFTLLTSNQQLKNDILKKFDLNLFSSSNQQQNKIRRTLFGAIETPLPSFLWRWFQFDKADERLKKIVSDGGTEQCNYFDDNMLSGNAPLLEQIIKENLKSFQYLSISMCMWACLELRVRGLSNDKIQLLQQKVQWFEFELIQSTLLCKQLTEQSTEIWLLKDKIFPQQNHLKLKLANVIKLSQLIQQKMQSQTQTVQLNIFGLNSIVQKDSASELQILENLNVVSGDSIQMQIADLNQLLLDLMKTKSGQLSIVNCFDQVTSLVEDRFLFEQFFSQATNFELLLTDVSPIIECLLEEDKRKLFYTPFVQVLFAQLFQRGNKELFELSARGFQIDAHKCIPIVQQQLKTANTSLESFLSGVITLLNQHLANQQTAIQSLDPITNSPITITKVIKIPSSVNLVVIFEYLQQDSTEAHKRLLKLSNEDFNQQQRVNAMINTINQNIQERFCSFQLVNLKGITSYPLLKLNTDSQIFQIFAQLFMQVKCQGKDSSHIQNVQRQLSGFKHLSIQLIDFLEMEDINSILGRYQCIMFEEAVQKMPNLATYIKPDQLLNFLMAQNAKSQGRWPSSQIAQLLSHTYLRCEMYKDYHQYSSFLLSLALNSIFQAACGLNDRHLENITISDNQIVNIDVEKSFFQGLLGPQPEIVPFRMTKLFEKCFVDKQQMLLLLQMAQKSALNQNIKPIINQNFSNQQLREYMYKIIDDEGQVDSLTQLATNQQALDKMWYGFMAWM